MFFRDRIQNGSKYLNDRSTLKGSARYVILPNDESELREAIRYANKGNTKVTVSGNRTGSAGGAVPCGGDVMSMEYLRGIVGVGKDEKGVFVRVLPCTTISAFNDIITNSTPEQIDPEDPADVKGLSFPVKEVPTSTVGGCIAANRSDIRRFVRRIKVVFTDGTFTTISRGEFVANGRWMVFTAGRNYYSFQIPSYTSDDDFGPKVCENMDLIDLFIGSEGIFGIITEADVYVSSEACEKETLESGKLFNGYIKERYGQKAVEEIVKVKGILDPNYILNVGNLI